MKHNTFRIKLLVFVGLWLLATTVHASTIHCTGDFEGKITEKYGSLDKDEPFSGKLLIHGENITDDHGHPDIAWLRFDAKKSKASVYFQNHPVVEWPISRIEIGRGSQFAYSKMSIAPSTRSGLNIGGISQDNSANSLTLQLSSSDNEFLKNDSFPPDVLWDDFEIKGMYLVQKDGFSAQLIIERISVSCDGAQLIACFDNPSEYGVRVEEIEPVSLGNRTQYGCFHTSESVSAGSKILSFNIACPSGQTMSMPGFKLRSSDAKIEPPQKYVGVTLSELADNRQVGTFSFWFPTANQKLELTTLAYCTK